jgi:DNA-binding MarR family transcriptional regulator
VGSQGISLLYAVKPAELAIRHALDSLLRPTGVGTIPYTPLTVLERHDGLTASELARNSFVTAETMNELVLDLERRGLEGRDPHPDHARRLDLLQRCRRSLHSEPAR